MSIQITDYILYRWRYVLGYTIIGVAVIALLVMAGLFVPGGISQAEMQSVIASDNLSIDAFSPQSIVNLPYHVLQRLSIDLLGVSNLSIKLPSLILGASAIFGMIVLLKTWFRRNVAVITTMLVITTGQFLFIAQNGAPSIIYVFWSVWLLVAATMVSRQAKWMTLWKMKLFGIAALSLYTPLSLYILIALLGAIMLHPHLRYLVRRLSKPRLLIAFAGALLLITPLIYAIIRHPSIGLTLLGIPDHLPNLLANAEQLIKQYFDFISPNSGMLMTPVYGLGSAALILLGVLRLITTKYTARSYLISTWIILLLPVLIINPTFTSVTFVPILLLLAMGINALLRNWYQLFPRNPYARIAGLIPLAVLIGGMVLTGIDRYAYGYLYDPNTANNFSRDLNMINAALGDTDRGSTAIVVKSDELAFYSVVASHHSNTTAMSTLPAMPTRSIIVSHASYQTSKPAIIPHRIITDGTNQNADRFYIYKTGVK